MPALLTAIAAQPFFKGMSEPHLQKLADCSLQTRFEAGRFVFRTGDPSNRFYLIERGQVSVELEQREGEPIVLQKLGPGRELGWAWILPPQYEQFSVRALEATDAIFFYGTRLRDQCAQDHSFGYELMSRMAQVMLHRIQALSRELLAYRGKDS